LDGVGQLVHFGLKAAEVVVGHGVKKPAASGLGVVDGR
jgi:hypothetical protein